MTSVFWLVLSLFSNSQGFPSNHNYQTYCNSRFQYCINYPDFLIAEPESANGDGRIFIDKTGTEVLRVYGRLNQDANGDPITLKSQYLVDVQSIKSEKKKITYQTLGKNYYVISGQQGNYIFYKKAIIKGDAFCFAMLNYNKLGKETYDPVSAEIHRSFK